MREKASWLGRKPAHVEGKASPWRKRLGGGGGGIQPIGGKASLWQQKASPWGGGGGTAHEGKKLAYEGKKPAHRGKELAHGRKGGGGSQSMGRIRFRAVTVQAKHQLLYQGRATFFSYLCIFHGLIKQLVLTGQLAAKYTAVLLFPSS